MIAPLLSLLIVAMSLFSSSVAADTTIVIMRHAEKPAAGLGQLTCQGLRRALALPTKIHTTYGKPSFLYAANPSIKKDDKGIPYSYIRPLATIEPLAIADGLPVDIDWGMPEIDAVADHLITGSGVQVVAWEHHWASKLASAIVTKVGGTASIPGWADDDFDSLYVIRVHGAIAQFSKEAEGLNGLPQDCPK
ncbi:uncharacterized protein NMK_1804 [Novimethylophilus kurashikiensis]|uniref:Histidine phosphatase family protein n=1 Tax=Novimethylophilus kurashikiensis TaxID=1825523 RepID=A0A2R5F8U8_9PROT|nr:hypothetical protein [Novimethylophilus kurashikiensis]GBG14239.1 uncharacterized protein NMK_1804 [Novimethylophilus kurashikiensis]